MDATLAPLAERIRAASADRTPLRIRGGGSKDFIAERLQGELLDTRGYAGIVAYEPSELVVTVRAGTRLAELEAELAAHGQSLPFEPPHFGSAAVGSRAAGGANADAGPGATSSAAGLGAAAAAHADAGLAPGGGARAADASAASFATVGGMVAAGLSGPARASVGSVRDYVLGAALVNGSGELLRFGGQVMKNVAGYDVSRLLAGSWGELGLIAEVSLKVLPVAPAEATLCFAMGQDEALRKLNQWGGQPLPLNASRWQQQDGQGVLWLRLRGARAAVEAACRTLGGERVEGDAVAAAWSACRDQRLPWFGAAPAGSDLWRLSVPQTAPVLDLPGAPLVEWHGGQRWVHAAREDGARVRQAAAAVGGHATLFRTGGEAPPDIPRFHPVQPALAAIQRELKKQFDPAGIFGPGRFLSA